MSDNVRLRSTIMDEMLHRVRQEPALECCGLLAGRDHLITAILPATNALASATAYAIAPRELFEMFRRMRSEGLEHLGIYHSHPRGENAPSPRDIAEAHYPEAAYFILSPEVRAERPVRAFRICDRKVSELTIDIV